MRDFSWNYFCYTGHIDAYLLFKDLEYITNINETNKSKEAEKKRIEQSDT